VDLRWSGCVFNVRQWGVTGNRITNTPRHQFIRMSMWKWHDKSRGMQKKITFWHVMCKSRLDLTAAKINYCWLCSSQWTVLGKLSWVRRQVRPQRNDYICHAYLYERGKNLTKRSKSFTWFHMLSVPKIINKLKTVNKKYKHIRYLKIKWYKPFDDKYLLIHLMNWKIKENVKKSQN